MSALDYYGKLDADDRREMLEVCVQEVDPVELAEVINSKMSSLEIEELLAQFD